MKKTIFLSSAAALAFTATPALAQSEGPATAGTFTGPRVEAILGYDIGRAGSDVDDDINTDNDQDIDGLLYGVAVGYDFDLGGVVAGVDAEYSNSTANNGFNEDGDFEDFGFGRVDQGRDLYFGIRLGARVGDRGLIYAKGGYTNTKLEGLAGDGETELDFDIDLDGYRLGAGGEYAISEKSFVKLEYRYSNYSEGEIDLEGDLPDSDRFDTDFDRHQIVAGVGFRF